MFLIIRSFEGNSSAKLNFNSFFLTPKEQKISEKIFPRRELNLIFDNVKLQMRENDFTVIIIKKEISRQNSQCRKKSRLACILHKVQTSTQINNKTY